MNEKNGSPAQVAERRPRLHLLVAGRVQDRTPVVEQRLQEQNDLAGADRVLAKPLRIRDLSAVIDELIG